MVAAWMSAETGVGPSIASGSQVCSGTWADFAKAPTSSRMSPAVSAPLCPAKSFDAESKVPRKSSVCEWRKMTKVPRTRPDVADHVDDEGLDARRGRRRAPVPERDQQVGRGADEGPADDEQQEVGRHHQDEHREDEEVQVGEEARVAAVAAHVGDRVEVDERRDAGDHERHEDAQRVDEDRDLAVDADRVGVVPRDVDDLARVLVAVLERDEGRHRGGERARDGERCRPRQTTRLGSTRYPSAMTIVPASGKSRMSQALVCI